MHFFFSLYTVVGVARQINKKLFFLSLCLPLFGSGCVLPSAKNANNSVVGIGEPSRYSWIIHKKFMFICFSPPSNFHFDGCEFTFVMVSLAMKGGRRLDCDKYWLFFLFFSSNVLSVVWNWKLMSLDSAVENSKTFYQEIFFWGNICLLLYVIVIIFHQNQKRTKRQSYDKRRGGKMFAFRFHVTKFCNFGWLFGLGKLQIVEKVRNSNVVKKMYNFCNNFKHDQVYRSKKYENCWKCYWNSKRFL